MHAPPSTILNEGNHIKKIETQLAQTYTHTIRALLESRAQPTPSEISQHAVMLRFCCKDGHVAPVHTPATIPKDRRGGESVVRNVRGYVRRVGRERAGRSGLSVCLLAVLVCLRAG